MDNFEGVGGEFFVAGRAARVDDPTLHRDRERREARSGAVRSV
jgi:hypothetical protein